MAKGKFKEDGAKKTITELFCSTGLTAELHGHMTFTLVLKSFQSVTAFIGNAVILIAFYKESSLHPPSKLLLRCLAAAVLVLLKLGNGLGCTTQPSPRGNFIERLYVKTWLL